MYKVYDIDRSTDRPIYTCKTERELIAMAVKRDWIATLDRDSRYIVEQEDGYQTEIWFDWVMDFLRDEYTHAETLI